jgi:aminopeptidase N
VVDEPTKMVSFTYGNRYREKSFTVEGVPEVVSFGPKVSGSLGGDMIHNVGADVVNSLRFFQWLFDDPLPVDRLQVTGIAANHGQAFRGFLHVSDFTYTAEHAGASELFRAHETAHQWWGHRVGWKSYRDQWLSESLAEYTAMMYVAAVMKNGDKHFEEILDAYRNLIDGSLRGMFSRYRRPWLDELDPTKHDRLGPICLGYRAGNAEMPQGYTVQVYHRGPLVLHMLRETLRGLGDGDELFIAVLRRFVDDFAGKDATTADFVATVNAVVPGDWTFWFDQWICGNPRPTYTWSSQVAATSDGKWQVTLEATQEDVPPGFVMPLPVALDFGGGRSGRYTALMDAPRKTFTFVDAEKPKSIDFAPRHSVIATVRKR